MSCISSNNNRFYVAPESTYGAVSAVTAAARIPAVSLSIRHRVEQPKRRDKTGSRTFVGSPAGFRTRTQFDLETYMTAWSAQDQLPAQHPLFTAALGGEGVKVAPGAVASAPTNKQLAFSASHNLTVGKAISFGSEIRFVEAIVNTTTVLLNAPFSIAPTAGSALSPTASFSLGESVGSVSLFDYWSPATALQRILRGASINKLKIKVNSDYHSFVFSGEARDVVDSATFTAGLGSLTSFPAEPDLAAFDYSAIPGNLGQAWLGTSATQFLTLTDAEIVVDNNLDLRKKEFGSNAPSCIAAGERNVSLKFNLFQQDDEATATLYQAAKQRSPISVFFQLGQQSGQLFGLYMKSVVLEVPEYNDRETRVQWQFSASRAQGTTGDELFMAFA